MSATEPVSEFGLISWIRERASCSNRVPIGIGDDCASLRFTPDRDVLVTTDMLMDGRHFRLGEATPEEIGYKSLAVNLSDIAAMAGIPVAAFVAVALPRDFAVTVAQGIHAGMIPLFEKFGVTLTGGDTNAWDGPLVVTVTLLGETTSRGPVRRSGAKPGDIIFVTGPLGGSLLGRHLHPSPRIAEALAIHDAVSIHSMIDISDGLASDLGHILEESGGLGAILNSQAIPIHHDAVASGGDPIERALQDGEDFELCFTVAPEDAKQLLECPPNGIILYPIGQIRESGLKLLMPDGSSQLISARGFDHLARTDGRP